MSAQTLNVRLSQLSESLKETQHSITRLGKPHCQPGSSLHSPEEGDVRVELTAEIHQSLKEQEEDLDLIRQEFEDQRSTTGWVSNSRGRDSGREKETSDLAAQVTRLGEDFKIARAQFRKAQLKAKRSAESAKRKEQELLFAGIQEGNINNNHGRRRAQEKLSQEEILANASSDVTAALRRTHTLMTSELERSRFAQETLENSTRDLATLSESYSNLDSLLSSSRSLASSLIYSQKSDTWYLETAFYLLVSTIAWLIFRRLLYGPGWWLLYLPTKLVWRLGLSVLQLLIGTASAAAGSIGAKNQSKALSQSSVSISTSLAQIPTCTGKIPKRQPGQIPPTIKVGAGGYGAKMQHPRPSSTNSQEEIPLSEEVGQMSEEMQREGEVALEKEEEKAREREEDQGTVLKERTDEDGPPNPKKRMWEEPIGQPQGQQSKDEL